MRTSTGLKVLLSATCLMLLGAATPRLSAMECDAVFGTCWTMHASHCRHAPWPYSADKCAWEDPGCGPITVD